jgi:hypothetical protein
MMRLSDILGCEVVAEGGERLGHAADVRVRRTAGDDQDPGRAQWSVTGIVVGRRGLLERFGAVGSKSENPTLPHDTVAWERVVRIEPGRVVVRS